ncbi:universal stress protein [Rhodococcus sp. BP-149]|uniref:universal stress protein n=1 Tax=unclassified Rhodococcus (in: high G+C Gram-positive bacteria) TaxID=192944 RepID=UPI001C9AC160|nr:MULTISPECIES: universal stress protein [unclassified Rhodococcus (in: high G+C Gram-positive bacteria)]MBY6684506.1 universal stress protein [Rhodococcus sp. BP-288]MBY6695527.1 universal stress protein [Rhodococcus sp. BP-188]MBY6698908.1 universal stress protein [Rhodococcus sp. BP-285]MBY6701587.1 universal stress protein [Rhodococcus sp. BP-283]MBY6712588.1 universal stress protein [Rhodococcus sp. BP-160]
MSTASMSALVGWLPDDSGHDALGLAARMATTARAAGGAMTVRTCTVLPRTWPFPSMAHVDAEYRRWLEERGTDAAARADAAMADLLTPADLGSPSAFFAENAAESAALTAAAATHHADLVVLGSSDGPDDRFTPGSTGETLLHSSAVPLALAPRGARRRTDAVSRISCAYTGTPEAKDALYSAAALAVRWNIALRLVAFAPRRSTTYPPFGGYDAEDLVTSQWREQATEMLHSAASDVTSAYPALSPTCAVGSGGDWQHVVDSVELGPEDLLVLGSSRLGPLARVFLGSTASKILRHSPVPILVVPRGSRFAR